MKYYALVFGGTGLEETRDLGDHKDYDSAYNDLQKRTNDSNRLGMAQLWDENEVKDLINKTHTLITGSGIFTLPNDQRTPGELSEEESSGANGDEAETNDPEELGEMGKSSVESLASESMETNGPDCITKPNEALRSNSSDETSGNMVQLEIVGDDEDG